MDKPYYVGFWNSGDDWIAEVNRFNRVSDGRFSGIEITKDECVFLILKFPYFNILDRLTFYQLITNESLSDIIEILNELRPKI